MREHVPEYRERVLDRLEGVCPAGNGWEICCPCPGHHPGSGHPGDQHPSLGISLGHDGRILINCRVGCKIDAVLEAAGLAWKDLLPPPGEELKAASSPATGQADRPRADAELVHAAYSKLLDELPLSEEHRNDLARRGLPERPCAAPRIVQQQLGVSPGLLRRPPRLAEIRISVVLSGFGPIPPAVPVPAAWGLAREGL